MVLEVAMLNVRNGMEQEFESVFKKASALISSTDGYYSHELYHCVETPGKYLLLARWRTVEDHTVGFRNSSAYQAWKQLLHHFYDPFPVVEHFNEVIGYSRTKG